MDIAQEKHVSPRFARSIASIHRPHAALHKLITKRYKRCREGVDREFPIQLQYRFWRGQPQRHPQYKSLQELPE
jgi:hypothetical protein